MKINLAFKPATVERDLVGEFGSLTLLLRQPTYQEVIAETGTAGAERIRAVLAVVDSWRGVFDQNGREVEFSRERFELACVQYPQLAREAVLAAYGVFRPEPSADLGKSETPPPAGSDGGSPPA